MMNAVHLVLIAVALGCDAFSVALGVAGPFRGQNFRVPFHFGLFQALMPIAGWAVGAGIHSWVRQWDHWVAFLLLLGVGIHMLWEAFAHHEEKPATDRSRGWSLVVLSTAVSIDALALGIVLGLKDIAPWWPCLVIGVVAGAMSLAGLYLGRRLKTKFGKAAEVFGAIVLLALAVKSLSI